MTRLTRRDCEDNKDLGDRQKDWVLFEPKFQSDEIVAVVVVIRQLARLQPKEVEAIYKYFIPAQRISTKLKHTGKKFSEQLLNAL